MKRERETRSMQLMSGLPWETVTLTTLSRDRTLFPELLSEARDLAMHGQEGKLVIHTAWNTEWRPFGQPRRKRPLRSVVLAPTVAKRIEDDIKTFLERRQWYADRGQLQKNPHIDPNVKCDQEYHIEEDTSCMDHLDLEKHHLFKRLRVPCHTIYVC